MDINGINLGSLTFPGRAGTLQRERAVAALIREIGDDYTTYNEFLAEELRGLGGDPHPDDYRRDQFDEYVRDSDRLRDIIAAEMVLRRAYAHRKLGKRLDAEPDLSTPLADTAQRLMSIETGRPTLDYPGSARASNRDRRPTAPPALTAD